MNVGLRPVIDTVEDEDVEVRIDQRGLIIPCRRRSASTTASIHCLAKNSRWFAHRDAPINLLLYVDLMEWT